MAKKIKKVERLTKKQQIEVLRKVYRRIDKGETYICCLISDTVVELLYKSWDNVEADKDDIIRDAGFADLLKYKPAAAIREGRTVWWSTLDGKVFEIGQKNRKIVINKMLKARGTSPCRSGRKK